MFGGLTNMKFGQRYSIRNNLKPVEIARGIWNPHMRLWRDIIEDYLYISKKRINNKLSIFKLQLNILQDLINNTNTIDDYKKLEEKLTKDEQQGIISKKEFEHEKEHINSEILSTNIINKALREIADGMVWKYFNYNRAILYMLADKQPIETIRLDQGALNTLYEFSDVFSNPEAIAIYNDITNFLRVGDITQIKEDGSIEIIEVKASKKRDKRVTRQKQRMSELVEFFNTGLTNYDGKQMKIIDSNIRQKTYLSMLLDGIHKARYQGYESVLIGNYLILEIVDFSKIDDSSDFIGYFESKHKSVKEEWEKRNPRVFSTFFTDKMDYSKNCAPFSIYPFDIETCTDIMMGTLTIRASFNFSELLQIIKKAGWDIKDALMLRSKAEIDALRGKDTRDISFLKVNKGPFTIDVPPSLIARMQYELLSPATLIAELEESLKMGSQKEVDYHLINYTDEKSIWK